MGRRVVSGAGFRVAIGLFVFELSFPFLALFLRVNDPPTPSVPITI